MRTRTLSLTPSSHHPHHAQQRYAYSQATDVAVKAALQTDIVAAYKEHGEWGNNPGKEKRADRKKNQCYGVLVCFSHARSPPSLYLSLVSATACSL
jgi:hypothetical protein